MDGLSDGLIDGLMDGLMDGLITNGRCDGWSYGSCDGNEKKCTLTRCFTAPDTLFRHSELLDRTLLEKQLGGGLNMCSVGNQQTTWLECMLHTCPHEESATGDGYSTSKAGEPMA